MKTSEEVATQEYNLLVADLFAAVPEEYLTSPAGQALIRYFMVRFKAYVAKRYETV
jgi:ABC-type phosphate transport system substrate-binding protein